MSTTSLVAPGSEDWILREDEALKARITGIQVSDGDQNPRPVKIWFGHPDPEIRGQSYPYITLDLLDVDEDKERVSNRYSELAFTHPGFPSSNDSVVVKTMLPTPMDLVYQVASWSRQPRHDRAILSQMNRSFLHPRYAQTGASDDTSRRIVVLDFAKRDSLDDKAKRLFRNVWTVAVKTEVFYAPLDLIDRVTTSNITVSTTNT